MSLPHGRPRVFASLVFAATGEMPCEGSQDIDGAVCPVAVIERHPGRQAQPPRPSTGGFVCGGGVRTVSFFLFPWISCWVGVVRSVRAFGGASLSLGSGPGRCLPPSPPMPPSPRGPGRREGYGWADFVHPPTIRGSRSPPLSGFTPTVRS